MAKPPKNLAQIAADAERQAEASGIDLSEFMDGDSLNPALERIYGELGSGVLDRVNIYVYKISDKDGKEPRIWSGAPGDFDLAALAKRFGSGEYRVKVMGPTPEGRIVIQANQVIPMLLDPAEDQRIEAMRRGELSAIPTQSQPALTADAIAAAVAAALKANTPAQPDSFSMFERMAGAMKNLIPNNAQGNPMGMKDVLEMARVITDLRGSGEPRASGRGVKDFALERGIALVEKMFSKHLDAQGNPITASTALPATTVVQPEGNPVSVTTEEAAQLEQMRANLRQLAGEAAKGTDAEKVAEFIYDDVPDYLIAEMATNPEWFKVITANVPECGKHSEWFFKLKDHLITYAKEDGVLTPDGHLVIVEGDGATPTGKPPAAA